MFDLNDKAAVVTGAARESARRSHMHFAGGARVFVLDRDEAAATSVASAIAAVGGEATFFKADVSNETHCAEAGRRILYRAGRCDILVNNAGIGHVGTVLTTTGEDFDRLYGVNVKGILFMTRALLPSMIQRKWGSVINLASIGGVIAVKDRFGYCATKFAVVGMTNAWRSIMPTRKCGLTRSVRAGLRRRSCRHG